MQALNGLLGVALLLAALAPVLMTGGPLIAAFMTRTNIMQHFIACLLTLAALFGGALIALQLSQGGQRLLGGIVLAALPWIALWAARRFVLKDGAKQP